ncbi:hypothetical protein ACFQZ4_00640 [Catellatospora coxensis]|uniref:Uncharacterized protein n=1 Tax=Catellatospora coxensis TaxID=310354 RepID=A0A8J3PAA8_9ACTN|nr:hypothetical protein [Catellatospora coxensis]GIG07646.1 hypothetical protein Cco03nite_43460 [Catellatospora coxensis]
MIERPTAKWRQRVLEQRQAVAAGTLSPDDAYAERLWPLEFTDAVDAALADYEAEIAALRRPSDDDLFAAAERVVLALNHADREHARIETGEREQLCAYIEDVITHTGIDVPALCARRGDDREALTAGRDW